MSEHLNTVTEEYLARFYEPKITAYEFLKCFFACLKQKNQNKVTRDIVEFLHTQKAKPENSEVLEEINFRSNGVFFYSDAVEDALFNLQNGGLLGKMNPSFGKILIQYNDADAQKAIEQIEASYLPIIEKIAEEFIKTH